MQEKTFIIAEAGVNHNGSIERALALIDAAVECGADAIKFQTFKAENLVSVYASKAEYQKRLTDKEESQFDMLKQLELDEGMHRIIIDHCGKKGILFLSTPFDIESVHLLTNTFHIPFLKISSGDITNAPLLLEAARTNSSIILSTGISTLGEVETALSILAYGYTSKHGDPYPTSNNLGKAYASNEGQQALKEKVTILHCTSEYPTPYEDVNLYAMDTLKHSFSLNVGLSDHTMGISVAIAAVARGAKLIEKHFTLDRHLPGPDHQASLEPYELKEMIASIRVVEKALGSHIKQPSPSELNNKDTARKSLVAKKDIVKGEIFTIDNLIVKRPGTGISPLYYWDSLGKVAKQDYKEDEVIQ